MSRKNVKRAALTCTLILLYASCASRPESPPKQFVQIDYTSGWKHLSTFQNIFVRDLDSKDRDTISFFLTVEEQIRLDALADSVKCWTMPSTFGSSNHTIEPNEGQCSFRIKDASHDHTISWYGGSVQEKQAYIDAMKVTDIAFEALWSRPEFKALPTRTWLRL
jgi:hypothetical protein